MKIFFSYGHDVHTDFIKKTKNDLNAKGDIDVWIDSEELKAKDDWEHELEFAIENSDEVVYFITPYSARRPDGYCLNELAFSIANAKPIIPVMLEYITPPLSICRLQYIDIQHLGKNYNEEEYNLFIENLYDILIKNKSLSSEGEHFDLLSLLSPIDFSVDLKKHLTSFIGREWLYKKVDHLLQNDTNKIIWIKAQAGFGKTAFSTMLQHKHSKAVGIHYCQFDSVKRKSSLSVIKTLIFQLSTQINSYKELLNTLKLSDINSKDENEIIEEFLIEPLNKIELSENYFFIIDAIDEAVENEKNKLVDLIKKFVDLPSWLKIIITSRPEPYLNRKFAKLKTIEIDTSIQDNTQDLHLYITQFLEDEQCHILKNEDIRNKIIQNSEGNILYLKEIIEGIKEEQLGEEEILNMPTGMDALYLNMFERYFEDTQDYKNFQRPIFELISSVNKKISLSFLSMVLEWDEYDLEDALEPIGSLIEIKENTINFFHKSVADWITDREKSGRSYFVSKERGNKRIVKFTLSKNINFIKRLGKNFDDILIIFNALYTVAYQKLDEDNEEVQEIYNKCTEIKDELFAKRTFKEVLASNNIDGQLDFILHIAFMDFEISKMLVELDESYVVRHILATKNYAYSLKEVGEISKAIEIQEYSVDFSSRLYEKEPKTWGYEHAELLNSLAQAKSSVGLIKDAVELDQQALSILDDYEKLDNQEWSKLYTNCLNSLAVSYGNFDKINKAIELEEKAKNIIAAHYLNNREYWLEHYIKCLNNLAISYKDIGQTSKAILFEEELLEIITPLHEKNNLKWVNDYALILNNLAFTYKTVGQINASIELEEKALEITQNQYAINKGYWMHLYIKSLLNLALSYKNTWLLSKAIEFEKKVVELTKKLYAQDKLRWCDVYTRSLTSLAISYSKQGKLKKAFELEDKSLSIRRDLYKNNPQRWVDAYTLSMNNSAIAYKELGDLEKAEELSLENLKIRKSFYENTPNRWADHYTESLVNHSFIALFKDSIDDALKLQTEAFQIKEKLYNENPDLWADSFMRNLIAYGYSYFKKDDLSQAIHYEEWAYEIVSKLFDEHNTRWIYNYFTTLATLSISLYLQDETEKASQLQNIIINHKITENLPHLNTWVEDNFSVYKILNFNNVSSIDELYQIKEYLLSLEYMQKKSPHRWSDAFK